MAQSAASEAGKKEGETRDLLPFKERGRETVNVDHSSSRCEDRNVESDTFRVSLFKNESSFIISI